MENKTHRNNLNSSLDEAGCSNANEDSGRSKATKTIIDSFYSYNDDRFPSQGKIVNYSIVDDSSPDVKYQNPGIEFTIY